MKLFCKHNWSSKLVNKRNIFMREIEVAYHFCTECGKQRKCNKHSNESGFEEYHQDRYKCFTCGYTHNS